MSDNPWKVGDKVHSAGTGLAMTVVKVYDDEWVKVYHHMDERAFRRKANTIYACPLETHPELPQPATLIAATYYD